MPLLPANAGNSGGTGNALSDAIASVGTAGVQVDPAQTAAAINTANAQSAAVASDCLWPPAGQITFPIIPGLVHQSVSIPCLLSYSEARAVFGAGLFAGGIVIVYAGVSILAAVAAVTAIGAVVNTISGTGKTVAAARGIPAAAQAAVGA